MCKQNSQNKTLVDSICMCIYFKHPTYSIIHMILIEGSSNMTSSNKFSYFSMFYEELVLPASYVFSRLVFIVNLCIGLGCLIHRFLIFFVIVCTFIWLSDCSISFSFLVVLDLSSCRIHMN